MIASIVFFLQKAVLWVSFAISTSSLQFAGSNTKKLWILGPHEIAGMLDSLNSAIENSLVRNLTPHKFYSDISMEQGVIGHFLQRLRRLVLGPIFLGFHVARKDGFVYVSQKGYLLETNDFREYEFRFIKRSGLKIVVFLTGNDIRSPKLMKEFQARTNLENIATNLDLVSPVFSTEEYDIEKRNHASSIDLWVDRIYTFSTDQMSYITRKTEPFFYMTSDEKIYRNLERFDNITTVKILHAPSSPFIKGTTHVRSAINSLLAEGFEIQYEELINVKHNEVLAKLRECHILINELYSFVPGVLGIEGMASGCAVITRADEEIEPDLPEGSNRAWIIARADNIYEVLKKNLLESDSLKYQAKEGLSWIDEHARISSIRETKLDWFTRNLG